MPDEPTQYRPGYATLRRFRESRADSDYFLTCNVEERKRGLDNPELVAALRGEVEQLAQRNCWSMRCGVVMPDHLHLVVRLGATIPLGGCIKSFKGRLATTLRGRGLSWQEGYYDRRLRDAEELRAMFLYVFLNPYRAELVKGDEHWPGYFCSAEDWEWFQHLTRESLPEPDWLR